MTIPVTMVTRDASLDDLSLSDYRDIYDELRGRDAATGAYAISLDKFVTLVTSAYSKAQWSKYHNGEAALTRTMRNELRRTVGLPALPATVAEATATASPDAAVWQVGVGPAEHVIMVTAQQPITLHVNGAVSVASNGVGLACNPGYTGKAQKKRPNRRNIRYSASDAQEARRLAIGAKRAEVIDAGLRALEARRNEMEVQP